MATLGQVGFYTPQDLYYYVTDNRPLQDLEGNIELIAEQLDGLWAQSQAIPCVDSSTVANSITISSNALSSTIPADGQIFAVSVANTCTGPTVLTLNGSVSGDVLSNGNSLQGGELLAGAVSLFLYDGGNWLIFSQSSGSFQLNEGSEAANLVTEAQLEGGSLPASFGASDIGTTTVNGAAAFSSVLSLAGGTSGGELVNLGQIGDGFASQASLIDWTNVTTDTVLQPGQTAYYNFLNMTTANMPLYISCADYQIYEVTVVHLLNSPEQVYIGIMPNNTTYSGQFGSMTMDTSWTNQGQFYTPASATTQYGLTLYGGMFDLFVFDAVGGECPAPVFRTMKFWTGHTSTTPLNIPMIVDYSGGGVSGSTSSNVPGVAVGASGWQGNSDTPWTSLGTLVQNTFATGDTYSNLVLVKRLA